MLLFIVVRCSRKSFQRAVSIHLMLLFILITISKGVKPATFQYISCCYLSLRALALLSSLNCFNTSHVVIYHLYVGGCITLPPPFQYISCCYLSNQQPLKNNQQNQFQYISCCYLSKSYKRSNS